MNKISRLEKLQILKEELISYIHFCSLLMPKPVCVCYLLLCHTLPCNASDNKHLVACLCMEGRTLGKSLQVQCLWAPGGVSGGSSAGGLIHLCGALVLAFSWVPISPLCGHSQQGSLDFSGGGWVLRGEVEAAKASLRSGLGSPTSLPSRFIRQSKSQSELDSVDGEKDPTS